MSFAELLENLGTLTPEQREIVLQRVSELDALDLSPEQERLVQERREDYRRSPDSFITIDELERRLKSSSP